MYFMKYCRFRRFFGDIYGSRSEYEIMLAKQLKKYQEDGRIKDVDEFLHECKMFWVAEDKKSEPHETLEEIFYNNAKVIEQYVTKSSSSNGKKIQLLKTLQKQFLIYERASLQYAKETGNYQGYLILATSRKNETTIWYPNTPFEMTHIDFDKQKMNTLTQLTKDTKGKFLTSLVGLRKEIHGIMVEIDNIELIDNYFNNRQQTCQRFGTHQVFNLYRQQIDEYLEILTTTNQKDKLHALNKYKELKKTKTFVCSHCIKTIMFTNRSHHEKKCTKNKKQ